MQETFDRALSDFGKSARVLAERLQADPPLGLLEQVYFENHIHILHSAYTNWQRRNTLVKGKHKVGNSEQDSPG